MSAESEIKYSAVPLADQKAIWVGDTPIPAAEGCTTCEVFSERAIGRATLINPGLQKNLFNETSETGVTSGNREIEEQVEAEVKKRARKGIDGTCEFIEDVPTCWRRPENAGQQGPDIVQ